jgi:hypothetical protein
MAALFIRSIGTPCQVSAGRTARVLLRAGADGKGIPGGGLYEKRSGVFERGPSEAIMAESRAAVKI